MAHIVIDFETRSRLILGRHKSSTNSYKYARHPSTEALCMAWWLPGGLVNLWRKGEPFPFEGYWPDLHVLAFNAEFELSIWNKVCTRPEYDWPELQPEQISCLMANSSYAGLPRELAKVGLALGLGRRGKDEEGNRLMKRLCRPQRAKGFGTPKLVVGEFVGGAFDETPSKHERNEEYCRRDTGAEAFIAKLVPPIPKPERELWLAHREINERGVPVDKSFVVKADKLVNKEIDRLNAKLFKLSGGRVKTHGCLTKGNSGWKWMQELGAKLPDLQEDTVIAALKGSFGELPKQIKRALEIRMLCRDSSAGKYHKMLCHEQDARCQGAHVFYKAGPGRFAGAGVNFLNLKRLNEDDADGYVKLADEISGADNLEPVYERLQESEKGVIPTLGAMVRMAVCAGPGKKLVVCDYSSIEMRVLHWLAGDVQTLKQIADFDNGKGEEPYKLAAASIYSKNVADVTKAERQTGKVMILGCGYMSGAEKFAAFCAQYGIDMPLDKSQELVQFYRRSYPLVPRLWYALGKSAVKAVRYRQPVKCGKVDFYMRGCTLCVRLPSGRELRYYDAAVVKGDFGDEIEALDQRSGRRKAVGLPILVENVDQAVSRDLLADAMLKCRERQMPVVLHVYDEIVLEVDEADNNSAERLRQIMRDVPEWAKGLPVDAKIGESQRYTK